MTLSLQELVSQLEQFLPALREGRHADPFSNDVFEAVDDLLELGHRILAADTRTNYPFRVRQEQELWNQLTVMLQRRPPDEVSRYQPIFDDAEQLLLIAQDIKNPKEGHLNFLTIAREKFGFLQTDYGFAIASEEPIRIRFSSDEVYVQVEWAKNYSSSCSFGCESNPNRSFRIDDLLYLYGDSRYKSLPETLVLDSQNAIAQWVEFLASVFRQYGHELLSGRLGICDEFAEAQEARDKEYTQEMDRLYGRGSDPAKIQG